MSNASDYLEGKLLNHVFRDSSFSKPSNIFLALATGVLLDVQTGSTFPEAANAGSYSRVSNVSGDILWSTPGAGGQIQNMSQIAFPQAIANWAGVVSGVVFTDSGTYGAGNMLIYGYLSQTRTVLSGDTFVINSGNLTLTCA